MRVERSKTPLRHDFINHRSNKGRIVAECDIRPRGGKRGRGLAAKLLVFTSPDAMRAFWKEGLKRSADLGANCQGAVLVLGTEFVKVAPGKPDRHRMVVDPTYFCVIGLCLGYLKMEIICHEAMHAGFAYARRQRRNLWSEPGALAEEEVCYPGGIIAAEINRFLYAKGLYT